MQSQRVNRFQMQQKTLETLRETRGIISPYTIQTAISHEISARVHPGNDILENFVRTQQLESDCIFTRHQQFELYQEADILLSELKTRWGIQQLDLLFGNCKSSVLNSVIGPFGLGSFVASLDKQGGNVDTIHNARNRVFATENEKSKFENRGKYDPDTYHKHENYIKVNAQHAKLQDDGSLIDAYTGEKISRHDKRNLDHTVSAKEIHDDPGRVLAEINGSTLANAETNLNSTDESINKSKKAKTAEKFKETLKIKADERKLRIKELSQKENLNNNERSELNKLHKLDKVDDQRLVELDKEARKDYSRTINRSYYTSGKFIKNTAITGLHEGSKMGLQQALGFLLAEFFSASFDEILDAYKHGFKDSLTNQSFVDALSVRLMRIAEQVASRWKDFSIAFKDGALSGFLSNLVTTLINTLVTTGKRLVRVIREGFVSIMKALKLMLFPPEGMTYSDAADAGLKLLATGATVSLGILAEEAVEKSITAFFMANVPILAPFAGTVSAVFVGAMTGIASAIIVYGLDQLDLFGVNHQRKHVFVMEELDRLIAESDKNIELMYQNEIDSTTNLLALLRA